MRSGPAFQPLRVRVTDSSTPPNPILGASVLFQSTVMRPPGDGLTFSPGDPSGTQTGMPVILTASQSTVQSDVNGLASIVASMGSFTGTLQIHIQISAGTTAVLQDDLGSIPAASNGDASPSRSHWPGSGSASSGSRQQSRVDAW